MVLALPFEPWVCRFVQLCFLNLWFLGPPGGHKLNVSHRTRSPLPQNVCRFADLLVLLMWRCCWYHTLRLVPHIESVLLLDVPCLSLRPWPLC